MEINRLGRSMVAGMVTPEGAILDAVLGYLQAERIFAIRLNSGLRIEEHNGKRRAIHMCAAGTADIVACVTVSGNFKGCPVQWVEPFFFEIKSETGRQSAVQASFERQVKDAGAQYFVIRSVENLKDVLHKHGAKTSTSHEVRGKNRPKTESD